MLASPYLVAYFQNTMEHESWYIIVNPAVRNGKGARYWQKAEPILRAHLPNCTIAYTEARGHATQLAAAAIAQGVRHIIGAGGDGTNHEIINGILQQTIAKPTDIFYALLPVGTGNDWRRTHRIPRQLEDWLQMLRDGKTILQDVGFAAYQKNGAEQQRYFANVAGMAYDAFVVRYAEKYRRWIVHQLIYLLMIVRCLFLYRLPKAKIVFDGQTVEDYFYTINIGIGRYSGGGMQLVPHANPTDGMLALTIARRVTKLGVLLNTYRFYNGTLYRHPKIEIFQVKNITVTSHETIELEADGELLGGVPVRFSILPRALRIVVPA